MRQQKGDRTQDTWLPSSSWPLSISAEKPPHASAVLFYTPAASGSDQRTGQIKCPGTGIQLGSKGAEGRPFISTFLSLKISMERSRSSAGQSGGKSAVGMQRLENGDIMLTWDRSLFSHQVPCDATTPRVICSWPQRLLICWVGDMIDWAGLSPVKRLI